jgi:hypothetical protein
MVYAVIPGFRFIQDKPLLEMPSIELKDLSSRNKMRTDHKDHVRKN